MHVWLLLPDDCCGFRNVRVFWRANGDEDFEQFLESVRERSLTTRTKIAASQGVSFSIHCNHSVLYWCKRYELQ